MTASTSIMAPAMTGLTVRQLIPDVGALLAAPVARKATVRFAATGCRPPADGRSKQRPYGTVHRPGSHAHLVSTGVHR